MPQRRSPLMMIAIVAGAVVLLVVGGIASRLLFDNNHKDESLTATQTPTLVNDVTPKAGSRGNQNQNEAPPGPTERPSPQSTAPPPENRALKREIEDTLNNWAAAARDHDLDAQMSYYADTLDTYFLRRNVSAAYVRSTRDLAFSRYTKLDVQLGPITVDIDPSGSIATATFDKTYRFEGDKILSGSVRQELTLTNISGRWLITGERDKHVYYVNK
jgi:ketosteroid isomerase-like protein